MADDKKKKKGKKSLLKREAKVEDFLSTGSTGLNMSISCGKTKHGGIPTRRIVEFSGTGASGKTYICGELGGDAIRKGYKVYVDDIERRWDLDRLTTFGIERTNKKFHYLDPSSSIEGCFETMFKVLDKVKNDQKLLYIIDPIAALYALQEKKSDKMSQARAKALQKYMRFLKDRVTGNPDVTISVVFSNQLIDAVGQKFGPTKITPGGNAMVHWPSVRVRFDSPGRITHKVKGRKDDFDKVVGIKLRAEVLKNSEDDAFRKANFTIQSGYGIDDIHDNALWLKNHTDVLGEADSWFKFPKHKSIQGIKKFVRYVEKNDLEIKLANRMRKYYTRWHKPSNRKPKVRI